MEKIIHKYGKHHTELWKILYTSVENFPLHVWVNNFQYSMENFRRFFLECTFQILLPFTDVFKFTFLQLLVKEYRILNYNILLFL